METFAGIDLHANNNFIGIIDQDSNKHINCIDTILKALNPFKQTLKGVLVESTFNWYWLVDALKENGYKVHLANPVL